MKNKSLQLEIKNLSLITFAMFLMAVGLNMFFVPSGVFTTGTMGFSQEIAIILAKLSDNIANIAYTLLTSIIYWIINVPIILLGWFKVGRKFTLRTFFGITMLSIFTALIPSHIIYVEDQLLSVITGSILIGTATGLSLRVGASSGGTDIIALYISLFLNKSFGLFNFLINLIVITIAIILNNDLTTGILMMVSIFIISTIVDKIYNLLEKRTLFIVTKEYEKVREAFLKAHYRGLTVMDTEGGLTREKSKTIMITVERGELYSVIETVKNEDPKCFINIYKVDSVIGEFNNNYRTKL